MLVGAYLYCARSVPRAAVLLLDWLDLDCLFGCAGWSANTANDFLETAFVGEQSSEARAVKSVQPRFRKRSFDPIISLCGSRYIVKVRYCFPRQPDRDDMAASNMCADLIVQMGLYRSPAMNAQAKRDSERSFRR